MTTSKKDAIRQKPEDRSMECPLKCLYTTGVDWGGDILHYAYLVRSFMLVLLNIIIYRLRIKNKQGQQKKDRERK